jgi:hypothetical protein
MGVNEVGLLGEVVALCMVEQNVSLWVAECEDAALVVVLRVEDYWVGVALVVVVVLWAQGLLDSVVHEYLGL